MDLSLDEIIKSKKISVASSKKFPAKKNLPLRRTLNRPVFKESQRIADARIKIIQKNRSKIRDARDKLAEITRSHGDVRKKILGKQFSTGIGGVALKTIKNIKHDYRNGQRRLSTRKLSSNSGREVKTKGAPSYRRVPSTNLPDLVDVPRGYVDYDNMERMEEEEYAAASRLSRTVKNDIANRYDDEYDDYDAPSGRSDSIPPAPRRLNSWGSANSERFDPFEVYEVPRDRRASSPDDIPPPPPKGILRKSVHQHQLNSDDLLYQRRYIPDSTSHLSYEMRSRLERAPDPHASMGIFANPLKISSSSSSSLSSMHSLNPPTSLSGYRIVVSNLHTSVSQSDIRELFEDIGELYDSRIVRPGIAEVIYKSLNDAETAVDTYHNRQLDGQPMKCLLVNPRASNKPTAPAIKTSSSSRLSTGKTPLEIDIDALHKVLFRRH